MAVIITGNNTPTAGGITYGDGTTYATTTAGTSGRPIVSGGAGAPTFRPYTLPAADGSANQLLQTDGVGALSFATVSAGFTLGTPVASTSGTSIDFTGIPAGVKQIVVNFYQVSTSGTNALIIQLGDSGGIETTGYIGGGAKIIGTDLCGVQNSTNGFRIYVNSATSVLNGSITITLQNSSLYQWAASGNISNQGNTEMMMTAGVKPLSAELDRVRITAVNGIETFDNGEINIAYI